MAASKLVIVESPAKARTIARFLGKDYKVEASQGHVRDFPKSQLGVDVDNDFALKYITIHGRGKILTKIRKEAKSAQEIYLATDPDREGEAISWHLAYALGMDVNQPNRIEFHEITQKAITDAIKSPRTIEMGLVDAQQARRALDRLVGYKLSPLLWAKIKKGLSAGRVQSVALRMLVEREQDIEAFIPEEYWDVTAHALLPNARGRKTTFKARLVTLDGKKAALSNEAEVTAARERVEKAHFAVYSVKNGEKRKQAAPPFTTSSLQQEASRRLNTPFGIVDLSLAPTPAVGDSVARILETMGLEVCGTHGTTAALALLNDAVKKGGVMASGHVGGLSGAFIPVSEDEGMIAAAREGTLTLDKLEAMTCVCSVGLDMIAVPGDTSAETLSAILADEAAIGMINNKTTAVRLIPAPGKTVGDTVEIGGLFGEAPVMPVYAASSAEFIARGGRIPAPLHSLRN